MIMMVAALISVPVGAVTENQEDAIKNHCEAIREDLKKVQKADARTRVYLGALYETILTDFVVPLNVRLVENNLSGAEFIENQNNVADTKTLFANDFISYQQNLEELVLMDCKKEPEGFYNKLEMVRKKRKIVEQDVLKMRNLISEHVELATQLKGKL